MRYVSTRGRAPELGFTDALLTGLATDGGLYVPQAWPSFDVLPDGSYARVAAAVVGTFVGDDIAPDVLAALCDEAYATFRHPAVAPLVQIDDHHWLLELFHGPTLAFKDVALQLVGRLFDHVLGVRGERLTIVGATSGDTGSAAIDGVRCCANVDIVILYPQGRVSEVQRRQMTTVDAANVHAVAVEGTFDDCQDLVKAMFADAAFRDELRLSAVNSINVARLVAQVVYYVTASSALRRASVFCVPTGNFGNVLSGWIAQRVGAPVAGLVAASNTNDIVTRFITDGVMTTSPVIPTLSPSMDIQISSNVERLLFEINDRDGERTAAQVAELRTTGSLRLADDSRARWIDGTFRAARVDDAGILDTIAQHYARTGALIDPHTAVGVAAVQQLRPELHGNGWAGEPIVTLATAHPAKFPDAVRAATGVTPQLPGHLADLFERPERTTTVSNDLAAVEALVRRLVSR